MVGSFLKQKVTWPTIITSLAIGPLCLLLVATKHFEAARAVFYTLIAVSIMEQLHRCANRRTRARTIAAQAAIGSPARTHRFQESVLLPHTSLTVWELIAPAEKGPLLNPDIRRGYHVPNTPEGVGGQQVHESLDGTMTVVEMTDCIPGRRATVKIVAPVPPVATRVTFTVDDVGGGCLYCHGIELDLPAGATLDPAYEAKWRTSTEAMFTRIRRVLSDNTTPS
jgi:hypothetical protein